MEEDLRGLLDRRLATQRLTGAPAGVADCVREGLAVQSQDPGTARWSLGMRADCDDAQVRQAVDSGQIVRAHVMRPTWHYVHRDDLRWLQQLTGARMAGSMPARHRQLGVTPQVTEVALGILQRELSGGTHLTRKQLTPMLPRTGAPHGQVVGHLLMLAEACGLVCSGCLINGGHSYALADEWLPAGSGRFDADQATRELVRRFFIGHGPASVKDLARWSRLTMRQIRSSLAELEFGTLVIDGVELWFDPGQPQGADGQRLRSAFLLPVFDEAFLTYLKPNFPQSPGNPRRDEPGRFGEAGGGLAVVDLVNVGIWKRSLAGGRLVIRFDMDPGLPEGQLEALSAEAARMAAFHGLAEFEIARY
ncbi:MAG: winged helix DNA-binding domain-containing protein [Brooklawnia sp.]|jgi:hypothetical protein